MNNIQKKYFIFFINLLLYLTNNSGNAQVITGNVINEQNQPLELITLTIHNSTDSTLITGFFSQSYIFSFQILPSPPYLLKISRLGYYPYWQSINKPTADTIALGEIVLKLKSEMIEGVTVTAEVPLMEVNSEGIKINVASTQLKNLETLTEVISNAPGVIIDDQGNVEILGRGNPLILVDNKELHGGSTILDTYKPEDIKSIQIIKNPGAKYDAKYRSVINIITSKKRTNGTAGWVYNKTEYAENLRNNTSFLFNKHSEKFSHMIRAESNIGDSRYKEKASSNIYFTDTSDFFNLYELDSKGNLKSTKIKYVFGYEIDEKNLVGFRYEGNFGKSITNGLIESELQQNDSIFNYVTNYEETDNMISNTFNINYSYNPDSITSLTILADYNKDNSLRGNQQLEQLVNNNINSSYGNEVDYTISSVKADFGSSIKNFINYETGIKFVQTINNNDSWFDSIYEGSILPNEQFTKTTQLMENIGAGYFALIKDIGKFSLKTGMRSEFNQWQLYENDVSLRDSSSLEWFPSASCFYMPFQGLNFGLSYARKIKRPGFQSTTRTLYYVNKYLYRKKNPYLKPIIIESLSLQAMAGQNLSLDLSYTKYNNYISLAWQNDGNILILSEDNFNMEEFSGNLNLSVRSKGFSSSNNFQISKPIFDYSYNGVQIKTDIAYSFSTTTKFHFPYDIDWKFIVRYTNKGKVSYITNKPYLYTSSGISKFFMDRKLRFSIYARYWYNHEYLVEYENVVMNSVNIREKPEFYFSIFYQFNKVENKTSTRFSSQSDEKSRK